ncbi:MAG TPA: helix-turn-helix domain-containing protein, partial [Anaeromyxobacteraceae bacterium]|nr:helix-turn-helix domain-containing protein [Anaeromyxobacteraceae bacterium]
RAVVPELFEAEPPPERAGLHGVREERERELIRRVLDEVGGNQSEAARRLGIGRSTLWRRLKSQAG